MSIFIDTSALLAVVCRDDEAHPTALEIRQEPVAGDERLIVTNYALLELHAVSQRRLGMEVVQLLQNTFVPVLNVHWISHAEHDAAVSAYLAANRRDLSLVDCTSFQVMRERAIPRAFAFDLHFAEQGFEVIPPPSGDRPSP